MPFPLFLVPALAGAAQGIGEGATSYGAANAMFTDEDKKRLAELEARRKAGSLGLDEKEYSLLRDRFLSPIQAQGREAQLRNADLMATTGQSSDVLKSTLARQAQTNQGIVAGQTEIQAANQAAKLSQEQEMRDLSKAKAQEKAGKNAAIIQMLTGGLAAAGIAQDLATDAAYLAGEKSAGEVANEWLYPESSGDSDDLSDEDKDFLRELRKKYQQ